MAISNYNYSPGAGNLQVKENSKPNSKPPLLEYWKPPKAVVFTSGEAIDSNSSNGKDSGIKRKAKDSGRDSNLHIRIGNKEKEGPADLTCSPYEINKRPNSPSSKAITRIDRPVSIGTSSSKQSKRFTWADSITIPVSIKDTDNTSLKSIPWGSHEKSPSSPWSRKNETQETITLIPNPALSPSPLREMSGTPPAYRLHLDDEDTLKPHWWQVQYWSTRKWILIGVAVLAILAIVVPVVVVEEKKNRYPDYTELNYTMVDQFTGTEFFNNFEYFDSADPTNGFAEYVDEQRAAQLNLTYASSSAAVVRVDTSNSNAVNGRQSVRITSKSTWDNGLFIFDVVHSPYGCATWPALWLSDVPNWPKNGEIDVMEQVNQGTDGNIMTLHTTDDCSMSVKRKETGSVSASNCYNGTNDNAGCGVTGPASTYGEAFNKKGGGIMAMELRSAGIRMWQFLRDDIPTDITEQNPDPSTWGEALADFPNTDCDIDSHFKNQTIVVNIEICGDWAGATSVYSDEDQCPGICTEYAQTNATAFSAAYFEFGNFTIYQSK